MAKTKNDMARVIVAALLNMRALPTPDHYEVKRFERMRLTELADHYKRALAAIESVRRLRSGIRASRTKQEANR